MITIPIVDFVDNLKVFIAMQQSGFPNTTEAFLETMKKVRNYWKDVATGSAQITGIKPRFGEKYAAAIDATEAWTEIITKDNIMVLIEPDPKIARLCEDFVPAYDMKPGILAGPNSRRVIKSGPNAGKIYKNVPMRHGWGDSTTHFKGMPQIIHKRIGPESGKKAHTTAVMNELTVDKKGKILERLRDVTVKRGDRLESKDLPKRYSKPRLQRFLEVNQKTGGFTLRRYKHKAPIYEGLVRMEKIYQSPQSQSQYMTWRRVSPESDPYSWWHPGFQRNPISYHVEKQAREWLEDAIEQGLNEDFKEVMESGAMEGGF